MLARWPGNQCHCLSPTGNKVSNKLRLMLPSWISQHSAAALTVKSTVIPSLQQNLNECKFGLHSIITLASEDIYVGQNGLEMDPSALTFPHSKRPHSSSLRSRLEDYYGLGKLGGNGIREILSPFRLAWDISYYSSMNSGVPGLLHLLKTLAFAWMTFGSCNDVLEKQY
jgi:hypothetical protein